MSEKMNKDHSESPLILIDLSTTSNQVNPSLTMEELSGVAQISPPNTRYNPSSSTTRIEEVPSDSTPAAPPRDLEPQVREPEAVVSTGLFTLASNDFVSEDKNCPICLEEMESPVRLHPCGHQFHYECIEKWVSDPAFSNPKARCPTCQRIFYKFGQYVSEPGWLYVTINRPEIIQHRHRDLSLRSQSYRSDPFPTVTVFSNGRWIRTFRGLTLDIQQTTDWTWYMLRDELFIDPVERPSNLEELEQGEYREEDIRWFEKAKRKNPELINALDDIEHISAVKPGICVLGAGNRPTLLKCWVEAFQNPRLPQGKVSIETVIDITQMHEPYNENNNIPLPDNVYFHGFLRRQHMERAYYDEEIIVDHDTKSINTVRGAFQQLQGWHEWMIAHGDLYGNGRFEFDRERMTFFEPVQDPRCGLCDQGHREGACELPNRPSEQARHEQNQPTDATT